MAEPIARNPADAVANERTDAIPVSAGPKKRQKHYSYNENVDEPAKLINEESTDVEQEAPLDENEPVEGQEPSDESPERPVFEE